jgi:hypothetical protein
MVTWTDGHLSDPEPASDAEVRAAERALRVRLPADFLAVAQARPGARPQPSRILLPGGFGTAVEGLLHFADDGPGLSNILSCQWLLRDVLDKGVIPFALDIGHDVFCFNYRKDYDRPTVMFWGQGFGAIPLAPSFTAFLELLHDGEASQG